MHRCKWVSWPLLKLKQNKGQRVFSDGQKGWKSIKRFELSVTAFSQKSTHPCLEKTKKGAKLFFKLPFPLDEFPCKGI